MTQDSPDRTDGVDDRDGWDVVGPTSDGSARAGGRRRSSRPVGHGRPRRRRTGRNIAYGILAVVLLLVGAGVWLGVDAFRAKGELEAAADLVSTLQEQVVAGDREAAQTTLADLQEHSGTALDSTHGPHWTLAAALPWAGPNIKAVQVVSEVVDDLATDALPGLMEATDLVDPATFSLTEGRIDLAPLVAAAPTVVASDASIQASLERIAGVDTAPLHPMIASPVTDLEGQIRDVAGTTATAAKAVQLLPPMLGAEGPREYLLLVQNNAEPRATGGIPGSVVKLRAEDGGVAVVEQRSGNSLSTEPHLVSELSQAEAALFGPDLAQLMLDVSFTPDFPRTGELARGIWAQVVGSEVDGVLSVDPGALALVLGSTGPVPLPPGPVADVAGGQLTADNAVQILLNTVYLEIEDPAAQDEFFATTAAGVFAGLMGGRSDPVASVEALAEAARQNRLMVWSAHGEEQDLLSGTVLSGELVSSEGGSPKIGVYYNDGTAAKMGYYLSSRVTVGAVECPADGGRRTTVNVTLTNTAPADAANLPRYITGGGVAVPEGEVKTNVLVYAPEGGAFVGVQMDGGNTGVTSQIHNELNVVGKTIQLKPGESASIDYELLLGTESGEPSLQVTPIRDSEVILSPGPTDCQ